MFYTKNLYCEIVEGDDPEYKISEKLAIFWFNWYLR